MTRRATLPPNWDVEAGARLIAALDGAGDATRLIGGWVRDTLLGLAPADIDLATRLRPDAVIARLEAAGLGYWTTPSGLAHGTVTAMLGAQPVEVTTLRRDVSTDGRRATVAFSDDWREDAARRDFTINALSADAIGGDVHDYFGGIDDLDARRVRFIGDARVRIAEDHLRILRFFRFHARFGGAVDEAGLAACAARANDLMALSRERIAGELLKLLGVTAPAETVRLMVAHAILAPVLPEIDADGVARLEALTAREAGVGVAPDPLRRLAALLPPDAAAAEAIATRLKLSIAERRRLALAVTVTATGDEAADGGARQLRFRLGETGAIDRLLLGERPLPAVREALATLAASPPATLALGGGELIAMGLPKGPIVAATLQAITRQWAAEDFPDADRQRAIARAAVDQALRASQ